MQMATKLATVFPAVETAAIAEALRKAGGDTQLAAEALLRAMKVKARPRL